MIEITDDLVEYLANLSRLEIAEDNREALKKDLQGVIGFMEKLEELDTTGVDPLLHISQRVNVLRADEVKGSISRAEALQNAPKTDGTFFEVPKVIQK